MTNEEAIALLKKATMFEPKLENKDYPEAFDLAIKVLEARPKGEWIYIGMGIYECTNCKAEYEAGISDHCNVNNSEFKFCPNCGADMIVYYPKGELED